MGGGERICASGVKEMAMITGFGLSFFWQAGLIITHPGPSAAIPPDAAPAFLPILYT